ncbi:hypothetical protein A0H81_02471 [Grifola frondosa]|uniref:Uncharacterized protein n=1 Tax=Grifola frondosa TaxID=5627 RepID=A0A1C7MMJ4_GRIFR|nr:hypothetical protein A0H81_02471 [Grifola frondosa]
MNLPAPTSCRRQVEPGFSAALSQTELSIVWPSSTREAIVESTYLIPVMQAARREWLSRKLTEENRAARCALQLSLYKHELERIAAGLAKAEEVLASLEHYAQIRGLRG